LSAINGLPLRFLRHYGSFRYWPTSLCIAWQHTLAHLHDHDGDCSEGIRWLNGKHRFQIDQYFPVSACCVYFLNCVLELRLSP